MIAPFIISRVNQTLGLWYSKAYKYYNTVRFLSYELLVIYL